MNFVAWFLLVVFVVLFCCKICGCWKDNIYAAKDEYVFFRQCQVACFAFVNVWQLVNQQCIEQYQFLPVPEALRANCTLDIFIHSFRNPSGGSDMHVINFLHFWVLNTVKFKLLPYHTLHLEVCLQSLWYLWGVGKYKWNQVMNLQTFCWSVITYHALK